VAIGAHVAKRHRGTLLLATTWDSAVIDAYSQGLQSGVRLLELE
jgi:hypothetical protein